MKKQLLLFLMALLPVVASAYDVEVGGIYYNLWGSSAEVTSEDTDYNSYSGSVVIPESITLGSQTYKVTSIGLYAFYGCSRLTSVTIPNSVTSIGDSAFYGCSLTSITIPNSVYSIYEYAFAYCSSLTSVTLGNSVESIWEHAFYNCSRLTSIIIPESVTSIGFGAFDGCYSLTSVTIPNSVTSIWEGAFYGSGLTSITIPNSVTSIGKSAFSCCGLTSITIPNSVTDIGMDAFNDCDALTSVTIGNSVTTIGYRAFYSCSSLTSVTIGSGVTSIGGSAFYDCSLADVYCCAENVPSTYNNAFENSHISFATLHVPAGSINAYKRNSPWNFFGNITSLTYTLTYMIDNEIYQTYEVEYGSTITPEEAPTKEGYTFSGWSEIPVTMPAHDVVVTGSFIPNNYTLTYIVDGEVYKTYSVAYGATLVPEEAPTKEGYTFSGWTYIPATMPAQDVVVMGLFTINSYTLTYMVDGEEYKSETLVYGTEIVPEEEPSKEGYTFSGWSEIPATMPAQDVVVTGSFNINSYTLSYIVDGEVYKTYEVDYGAAITPEAEPTKEGYSFSGWSEIPETMPANDVEVTGFFTMILATGIALDKESLLFNSIEAQKLNVTLTPADPYNKTVNWSSTDTDVAIVDEEGLVTPVGNGEAYIIVSTTDGTDLEARCMVTVDFKASILSLDKEEVTFVALENLTLTASVTPDKASQEVTWSSSNASVVSVSETGTITPLRNGEATITATTTDGTDLTATCKVTVDIPSLYDIAVTQTTLTIQGMSETSEAKNIKLAIDGEVYELGDEGKLTGLAPGRAYHIEVTADIEGYTWTEELDVTMAEIAVNFDCKTSPTTLDISVSYDAGDATVTGASFEGEEDVSTLNLIGLEPAQTYSFTYNIVTEEGGTYTYNTQLQTEALSLKVTRTKVVAVGDVVVVASSNITEEENVNVGFEWRRYDWPDEIETKTGAAYIYAGTIEGSIKNLNADRFWKIRPYFLSQAGNRFLGDWVTIDPSDVSYFEPSVHTYNSISVEGNTAEVKGFVMQGSDDVESQGFMYWEASPVPSQGGVKRAQAIPANAKIVKANGNMMVASLENLEFETNYCYVAFAKTSEGETFYGEQQSFTTGEMDPDGIKEIEHSPLNIEHSEGAVYNLAGQKMVNGQSSMVNGKMPKGINIIRYPDGTSKKVLVK